LWTNNGPALADNDNDGCVHKSGVKGSSAAAPVVGHKGLKGQWGIGKWNVLCRITGFK